jgi:hypothetical protein
MTNVTREKGQYNLWQILGIWLAAGLPMWILGWIVYPALSTGLPATEAGLLRIKLLTLGLIWEFVLAMIIVHRGEGELHLATVGRPFWLSQSTRPTPDNSTEVGRRGSSPRCWWSSSWRSG